MRIALVFAALLASTPAFAVPTAQVAKECLAAAYKAYPLQRPGMKSGNVERTQFYRDCIEKHSASNPPPEAEQQLTQPAPKQP
jgi:hypothetical protein